MGKITKEYARKVFPERFNDARWGTSYQKLSDATGIPKITLSYWGRGKMMPTADALPIICKELNISADYLLGIEDCDLRRSI